MHQIEEVIFTRPFDDMHYSDEYEKESLVAKVILDAIDQPVLLVDQNRVLHHINRNALEFLKQSNAIRPHSGSLCFSNERDARRLVRALQLLGSHDSHDDSHDHDRFVIRVGDSDARPEMMIVVTAIGPDDPLSAFTQSAMAMLFLYPLGDSIVLDPKVLCHAYGMTPSEAMVAAQIVRGKAPAQIAAERRVSLQTVRAQIRAIFVKVGVKRQADLVQVLLHMPKQANRGCHTQFVS